MKLDRQIAYPKNLPGPGAALHFHRLANLPFLLHGRSVFWWRALGGAALGGGGYDVIIQNTLLACLPVVIRPMPRFQKSNC